MKNLKRNMWTKILAVYTILSFVISFSNTSVFAQTESEEESFVLASAEQQDTLKTEVAKLLLEVDAETAQIIQGELASAIKEGTIVLGDPTSTDAATDASAVLPDQAVASVATQIAKSTDAKNAVLANLNNIKQGLLTAPGTGTTPGGTPAGSQEALKIIDAMQQAIASGNTKAIQEAMRSAEATFRSFGEMSMGGFSGPQGEFAGPMGAEGGPSFDFFDRALAGAVPEEMIKTFSEGPGMGFDRNRMAEGFMADVGSRVIATMSADRPPEAVFREMAGMGFSVDMMTKAATEFMNNPGAFNGPMEGFRGPEAFGPQSGPQGGWTPEAFAKQGQGGFEFFAGQQGGSMPEFFGPAGTTAFEGGNLRGFDPVGNQGVQGDFAKAFEVSREFFAVPRDFEVYRQDFLDAKLALPSTIATSITIPTQSGSGGGGGTPQRLVYPGDSDVVSNLASVIHLQTGHRLVYNKNSFDSAVLTSYRNTMANSPSMSGLQETETQISIVWNAGGGSLVDINGRRVDGQRQHTNEPASAPTQAQINRADQQLYYENFRNNSGQAAATSWNNWLGTQNYSSQAIRDSIRTTVNTQKTDGNTTAQELTDKRAAIEQLRADIAASKVPDCHSLQLHNDNDVKTEHDQLSNIHCP